MLNCKVRKVQDGKKKSVLIQKRNYKQLQKYIIMLFLKDVYSATLYEQKTNVFNDFSPFILCSFLCARRGKIL